MPLSETIFNGTEKNLHGCRTKIVMYICHLLSLSESISLVVIHLIRLNLEEAYKAL